MDVLNIWDRIVQYGFAGFAVLLLWFLWRVYRDMNVMQREVVDVVKRNTEAFTEFSSMVRELRAELKVCREDVISLRDKLIARPCIAKEE